MLHWDAGEESLKTGHYVQELNNVQTGNTIFAALGVSDLPKIAPKLAWTKSVCAILCYLLGAALTGKFHRACGERKRWVLAVSFTVQALFILISAVLVRRGTSSGSPTVDQRSFTLPADLGFPWTDFIPIGLLSSQAAAKVITSRAVECSALPCVVLTTLYGDLISDPSLLSAGLFANTQRNRRASGAASYFLGAVAGGATARTSTLGFSGGLGVAALVQVLMAGAWMLWRADDGEEDDDENS